MMISAVTDFHGSLARGVSLLIAVSISVGVLAWPKLLVNPDGHVEHGWLILLMWGMAAGFVHGVGFVPRNRMLQIVLGPIVAWGLPLLVIMAMLIFR